MKCSYMTCFGPSPYFHDYMMSQLKVMSDVISFDEYLSKVLKWNRWTLYAFSMGRKLNIQQIFLFQALRSHNSTEAFRKFEEST